MDGPVFDAMLKNALEEALRRDLEEAPPAPRPSRRQRVRMRRLLASASQPGRDGDRAGPMRRYGYRSARWLAAVVIAALLTGTAAGYALRNGELFQRLFEESGWAVRYGGAADMEQLLDLGGEPDTVVSEGNGLRFELLDAVSDGQFAMACVQLTVLDQDFLKTMETPGDLSFRAWRIQPVKGGEEPVSCGLSIRSWEGVPELEEGQYRLIFSLNDCGLADGGQYEIILQDPYCRNGQTELNGQWRLSAVLHPADVRRGAGGQSCQIAGRTWAVDRLTVSPLVLNMELHSLESETVVELEDLKHLAVRLENGRTIHVSDCVLGITQNGTELRLALEFQMPIDANQVEGVLVGEEWLSLGGQE